MHPHEETALQLALTDAGVPHAATSTATLRNPPHGNQENAVADAAAVVAFDAAHHHHLQQQHGTGHDDDHPHHHNPLMPLALPPSPSSHHHAVYGSHARLAMLSEAGGGDLHGINVHAYFPSDTDTTLASMGVGHFDEMKLDGDGDGDGSDKSGNETYVQSSTSADASTRKRKVGTNASIDLQTKIRLIELAEEFQYDPKSGTRGGKQDGTSHHHHPHNSSSSSRDTMSGIRLAAQFGLNKSTVSRILKRKEEFKKAYYKDNISGCSKHINKKSKFEKLNRLVENWFDVTREKKVAVSDTLIRDVGKRFAEELGIDDFRGSNGWVRSLRNRKEQQARNMSFEAMERERLKKDAEAMERVRVMFPSGMKDMATFFKDLTIFLEKDGGGLGVASQLGTSSTSTPQSYMATLDAVDDGLHDADKEAEEFLKKKMIESMRLWSQELMELELAKMKKRLKPRAVPAPLQQQQQQQHQPVQLPPQHPMHPTQQLQQQQAQQQAQHQTAVI